MKNWNSTKFNFTFLKTSQQSASWFCLTKELSSKCPPRRTSPPRGDPPEGGVAACVCWRTQLGKGIGKGSGRNSSGPHSPGVWGRQRALKDSRGVCGISPAAIPTPWPSRPFPPSLAAVRGGSRPRGLRAPSGRSSSSRVLEPLKNDSTRKCV